MTAVDTGMASAGTRGPATMLAEAERKKRAKYDERIRHMGATFTPLACSVYGTLGQEASLVLHQTVKKIGAKKGETSDTMFLHSVRIRLAIVKAASLCLRTRSLSTPFSEGSEGGDGGEDAGALVADMGPHWGD